MFRRCFGPLFVFFAVLLPSLPAVAAVPVHELVSSFDLPPVQPSGGPLLAASDGYLWGTSERGGTYGFGTIYKVRPDGSDYHIVLSFMGTSGLYRGTAPKGGLVDDHLGNLWGTTNAGGYFNGGTIFKINLASGTVRTLIDFFYYSDSRGNFPSGELTLQGTDYLWGKSGGGNNDNGTIFKVNVHTGALTTVYQFPANNASVGGRSPDSNLVPDGAGFLWSTTSAGGATGYGTIFKIDTATGVYTPIHSFSRESLSETGSLVSDGQGYFWGTDRNGGPVGSGSIFKVNASTGELTTVFQFDVINASGKGTNPEAGLVPDGAGFFWGTTTHRGAQNYGTLFKIKIATGELTTVLSFSGYGVTNRGSAPAAPLVSDGAGGFFGTTSGGGGFNGNGTLFRVNASSGLLTTLVDFSDAGARQGHDPFGGLVSDGHGGFLGTTHYGGKFDNGILFRCDPATGACTTLAEFSGSVPPAKGRWVNGSLVDDGHGHFWGTTNSGGAFNRGTVFRFEPATGIFTTMLEFNGSGDGSNGQNPVAGLVNDGNGHLRGRCLSGGEGGGGTIFTFDASTGALLSLLPNATTPITPTEGLVADGQGYFWGSTTFDPFYQDGNLFKVNGSTGVSTVIWNFYGRDSGVGPKAPLFNEGTGFLWGTTGSYTWGNLINNGIIFKIDTSTGKLTKLVQFTGTGTQANAGSNPGGTSLLRGGDGNYYGMTLAGGPGGGGTVYRLRRGPTPLTLSPTGISDHAALLHARVNPNGAGATAVSFQYGTDPTLAGALTVTAPSVADGAGSVYLSASISGLSSGQIYYYRVLASNAGNEVTQAGAALSFVAQGTASLDADVDGLLDDWEVEKFGTTVGHTALDDADGDGAMEIEEFAFDKDPLRPDGSGSPPPTIEDGYLTITLTKRAGASYSVESGDSPSVASGRFSVDTTTVLVDDATTLKVRDNFPVGAGAARFMRVRVTASVPQSL